LRSGDAPADFCRPALLRSNPSRRRGAASKFRFELVRNERTEQRFECDVESRAEALREAVRVADEIEAKSGHPMRGFVLEVREQTGRRIGQLHFGKAA
jgi:hypothetical protein